MKTALLAAAILLTLVTEARPLQLEPGLCDDSLKLAFQNGSLPKSELKAISRTLAELISPEDGSIDPAWLKEQGLIQLQADLTPFGRVKLTDGKKVLTIEL